MCEKFLQYVRSSTEKMVYPFFENLNKQTLDAYPRYMLSHFILFFLKQF